nr:MATH and LRR domain-containing protein PFE0570w-like [Vanessa tameamea]
MFSYAYMVSADKWSTEKSAILSSEPLISENIRESRQLNFAECCPCHESQTSADYDAMEAATTLDRCPCQSALDSESAPSIFIPTVRAVEPMRSSEVKTLKPLLKPEIGLASSVLETLQEVTDQEYQEALVRDATRTALNDREENLLEPEMDNTPRNIVNIILQPKDGHTIDDVMPEASHVQETRCVHPPLSRANSFDQMRLKPRNNVLGKAFPSSTVKSDKKYFDMANSASNIQEHKMPLKSNIIEDLKLKSDLLKMKLFSNVKNSLKDTFSNSNTLNQFDKQSKNKNSNESHTKRIPNYKFGSLLDYLKTSKQKNYLPTILKETDKKPEDISFSPSNPQNYYFRNNENIHHLSENDKSLLHAENLTKENQNSREKYLNDKFIETQKSVINDNEKNDCDVNLSNAKNFKETTYIKSDESMDAETSPTELNTSVVDKPIKKLSSKEKYFNEDRKSDIYHSTTFNNNMQNQISVKETVPGNYDVEENKEKNEFMTKNGENDEFEYESSDKHLCDADEAGSSDVFEIANIPQTKEKNSVNNVNDFGIHEQKLLNTATLSLTTTEKSFVNYDIFKSNDNKIFPNIKADVLKTLEKIKNANIKIQDKLRLNAQNVQNLDVINNSSTEIEPSTFKICKNDTEENYTNKSNNINTQDLQEMSDRILNLSLSNEKLVEPLVSDSTVSINNNTNVDMDNEISPSESKNTIISTNNLNKMKNPTFYLSDSLLKSSDNIENIVETFHEIDKNQDKINNDAIDSTSTKNLCENITPKFPNNNEVSSSNDQEKEMMSQASSPFVNSVRHTNRDFIVQPESNLNVKGFLDNLKSPFSFIEPKNIDTVKSYSQTRTRDNLSNWDKNTRLQSYKARVPSPDSLNLKTVPSLSNRKQDTSQGPFKDDAEVRSASTIFQYPVEIPSSSRLKIPTINGKNNYDSVFNLQKTQDILPVTESLNTFSENFKSRTDDALRNIKESIDDLRRSHITNQNNLVGEPQTRQNIFRTNIQPNDLEKKLQNFNSDLKDRLLRMSQRIPDILHFDDNSALQAKNKFTNLNNRMKSNSKYKPQVKSNDLPKSRTNLALKPFTSQSILGSSKKGTSKSNLNLSPNILSANLRKFEDSLHLGHKIENKSPLRKEMKRKPLKENKVTFSFTTSRPEITKLRPNQKIYNKPTPETLRSLIKLPKTSYKTPLQKSLEPKSKLKPDEPKHAASNQFTSHIAPDWKLGNSKTATFSSLEESVSDLCDDNTNPKNSGFYLKNVPESNETKNVLLSKMRDAVKGKNMPSGSDLNKKFLYNSSNNLKSIALPDAKQSASNNINIATPSFTDRPLKENVSYKCKMICFEDNEDSK